MKHKSLLAFYKFSVTGNDGQLSREIKEGNYRDYGRG